MLQTIIHNRSRFVLLFIFFSFGKQLRAQLTYNELAIQFQDPWTYKKLQLIPIRFKDLGIGTRAGVIKNIVFNNGIISFSEALRRKQIAVKENTGNGGADVSLLSVKSHSEQNILLLSGEIMQGGKQDRAFSETIIIPAGKHKNFMPVYCMEKGRWDDKPRSFKYAGRAGAAINREIDVSRRQSRIWKQIDNELTAKKKKNKTSAYLKAYNDSTEIDTSYLRFFINKMKQSDSSYAGFIAVTGNRIINAEIFSGTDICLAAYIDMVKSYVHSLKPDDGMPAKTHDDIKAFTDNFLVSTEIQKKYLATHGRIYYNNGTIIHLIAYD